MHNLLVQILQKLTTFITFAPTNTQMNLGFQLFDNHFINYSIALQCQDSHELRGNTIVWNSPSFNKVTSLYLNTCYKPSSFHSELQVKMMIRLKNLTQENQKCFNYSVINTSKFPKDSETLAFLSFWE